MNPIDQPVAQRYDRALLKGRDCSLPPGTPIPQPTSAWPKENLAVLERYRDWLLGGGNSPAVIAIVYIPIAGHVLGLNLKPSAQLDLDADLNRALEYVKAKRLSAEWTDMCRNALIKFRRFLQQERGQHPLKVQTIDISRYREGLPDWLLDPLDRYQRLMQPHWRPARLREEIRRFWAVHARPWQWMLAHHPITCLADVRRRYIVDYADYRLASGRAIATVNEEMRSVHAFFEFLQTLDIHVPLSLLRIATLKQPDRLPRFLTDDQVRCLRKEFDKRVEEARFPMEKRDALLDRAAFYLMWHAGLRLSEVEELRLEELDLKGRKLTVRCGKGMKDRTAYLTDTALSAVQEYLVVRGNAVFYHVFLYHNEPVHKDLLRCRIKSAGERAGVKVTPHQLRHTFATQLLNAGCKVTTIQKLMGHRSLDSTMIYARVHDRTVAEEYYAAMVQIEKQVNLAHGNNDTGVWISSYDRAKLLERIAQLDEPRIDRQSRTDLAEQFRSLLNRQATDIVVQF